MSYPFGAPFTWTFYPVVDDAPFSIPAQTLTLYVYRYRPSREQALTGVGAIAGPVSCALGSSSPSATFTIPTISDPDPNGDVAEDLYWVSVKYRLHASGDDQIALRGLELARPAAQHSTIAVSLSDMAKVYAPISKYLRSDQAAGFVETAVGRLKSRITKDGKDWHSVWNTSDLKLPATYMALSEALFSLVQSTGDTFQTLAIEYRNVASDLLGNILLEYGAEQPEGQPAPVKRDFLIFAKG